MVKDMTKGSPMKLILGFAIPMLMGMLFQQFYNHCVHQIVKLLKNDTSEQRHAVLPQHPLRFSDRQIPIHG
mgnify:CR=1 FL=1